MVPAGARIGAALALAALATALPAGAAHASFRGPDRPAHTPWATRGTSLAAKGGLSADQLRRRLRDQIQAAGGRNGSFVVDLDAHGRRLFDFHPDRNLILASNAKLFTTATYLERFGRRRLSTRLWARGHRRGHTLHGSLALVGGGDPALASRSFAREHNLPRTSLAPLARAVRADGIRRVAGDIKADPTIFDSQTMPHQTGITGINLGSISGLEFDSGWSGGAPAASPATLAGEALRGSLRKVGVKVTGSVKVGATPARLRSRDPLAVVRSPGARALITEVNTPSDATWAEMLTKRLGVRGGHQGTTAAGAERIERFTRAAGSHVSLENGSGLSRLDRATPRDVVALLKHMNRAAGAAGYRRSLARPCATGTVAERMCGTAAAGGCHLKTGTLTDVSALSGYCDAHGHRLAFAILMNSVSDFDRAHHAQDRMAALISRYRP